MTPPFLFSQQDQSWKLYDDSEVAIIEITVDPAALEWMYNHVESDSVHLASINFKNPFINETIDSVGLRIRGNTSRQAKKKSFKLSFNHFVKGREFFDVDNLNLNGEHNDPSIARSKLCWDLYKKIGVISSRASHAAVYINGEYYGLYVSVEDIDDEFLKKNFEDASGNLWKCLYPADLSFISNNPAAYKFVSGGRRAYDLKTNTDSDDYTRFAKLVKIINQTPPELFADSLESILNVVSALKYFAVNNLVGSWDDYWFLKNNYYFYDDPANKLFYLIPYDYDNTFGIDWFNRDWANINPYTFATIDGTPRPLIQKLLTNSQYRNLYTHFLEFYNENVYNLELWEDEIINRKNLLSPYAETDVYRRMDYGFSFSDFHESYSLSPYTNQHAKRGIREFVNLKNNSIQSFLKYVDSPPIVYKIDTYPVNPLFGDSLNITVSLFGVNEIVESKVRLLQNESELVSFDLEYAPTWDSYLVEENDRWTCTIPTIEFTGNLEVRISLTDSKNNTVEYPRGRKHYIYIPPAAIGNLSITELMALNESTITDENNQYEDWIEVFNSGNEPVNLQGYHITDNINNLSKWTFPGDLIIEPNQYKIIWFDNDPEEGIDHVDFRLDAEGEFIAIVSPLMDSIIDSITFPAQTADVSYGRDPQSNTWGFMSPTPGLPNTIVSVDEKMVDYSLDIIVYPNPFNPATTIEYSIGKKSGVNIEIYSLTGELIQNLNEGIKQQGTYRVTWNGIDNKNNKVTSGLYIVRVVTEYSARSHKMLLLK